MKKLILLVAFTLPLMAQAQPPEGKDWWACQSVKAGGLHWNNGQWKSTGFHHDERFILIGDDENVVTLESVGKVFGTRPDQIVCRLIFHASRVSCISEFSETFVFDSTTVRRASASNV